MSLARVNARRVVNASVVSPRARRSTASRASIATVRALNTVDGCALSTPRRARRAASLAPRASSVSELALAIDTSGFDQMFINGLKIGLPLYGAVVGAIFIFGTIAKVAFPEKYDAAMYGKVAREDVEKGKIDLDNLSEEDARAVAELEAEMRARGEL
ncbi:unnamed product [Ostreococcus tauri]|uniref:Unnamed product n=1 Tax=Ostreococcus tauri TaxID=70448 RepID=Q012J1_OSTTA|nr:unnamed product [Ostreococcus tauri]OUS47661.1 hypothetical protein BE221DRAFT_204352 [Ostreococcus tauri]CAL55189.1 unnamed product [Ostreococcus tauri]|eukprot:XP_003081020.1 unnamed product [Ostreococcus tauri]